MAVLPNRHDLQQRLLDYRAFDEARQSEFDFLSQTCLRLNTERLTLQSDLDDERNTRRTWKRRAEDAETAMQRKFTVVLVDGDGYHFRKAFYQALQSSGGSKAANELYTEVLNNLRADGDLQGITGDQDVLVNIYANKFGLAKTLANCDYISHPPQLDFFFCSFTQSRSLFQFIDCGSGKERVDAKLRDTLRFYAYNAQCQRIFLACSHDNGYIAELDKYRHDAIVMPKITLVHAAQTPSAIKAYAGLPFKSTRFDSVFETTMLEPAHRTEPPAEIPMPPGLNGTASWPSSNAENYANDLTPTASRSSLGSSAGKSVMTPLTPVVLNNVKPHIQPASTKATTPPTEVAHAKPPPTAPSHTANGGTGGEAKTGIPINRYGQRIDLKLRVPTQADIDKFEDRIYRRKLCNEHHLRDNCESYGCKYDHDPIDATMKNTLRHKARSIPCAQGSKCRRQDCFYGHQCPWGNNACGNTKCAFIKTGLHDIKDLEVARFVPSQPAA